MQVVTNLWNRRIHFAFAEWAWKNCSFSLFVCNFSHCKLTRLYIATLFDVSQRGNTTSVKNRKFNFPNWNWGCFPDKISASFNFQINTQNSLLLENRTTLSVASWMFHQLNSPFMLVHVKMFEKSSTIKTSWFCSQHEGKLFSNFRPPNTRRILISTEFKFSGLAVHPEHEREGAPLRDGKFISFKTNEALRSHNPATLWRLHTYFNSFRVFRIISTRESERVEPPRQWQNEWVWKWSQCAPECEGRGEWSKMNSLKINFISFILFLSVLCCSVCSQISRKCSLYCNPKVTIHPLSSNNSSSCTFRNIF